VDPKSFFEEKLKTYLIKNPNCLLEAGLRSTGVSVDISGTGGGKWTLLFDAEGAVKLEEGVCAGAGGCIIATSDKVFSGMLDGTTNVAFAYMMRKIKIQGESSIAVKVGLALQKIAKTL
jgi:putative sterol carrier protein